jgi:hypothetical protein
MIADLSIVFSIFPTSLAEVLDKMPEVGVYWCIGLLGVILAFPLAGRKNWLIAALVPASLWLGANIMAVSDIEMDRCVIQEAGWSYLVGQLSSAILPLGVLLFLLIKNRRAISGRPGFELR